MKIEHDALESLRESEHPRGRFRRPCHHRRRPPDGAASPQRRPVTRRRSMCRTARPRPAFRSRPAMQWHSTLRPAAGSALPCEGFGVPRGDATPRGKAEVATAMPMVHGRGPTGLAAFCAPLAPRRLPPERLHCRKAPGRCAHQPARRRRRVPHRRIGLAMAPRRDGSLAAISASPRRRRADLPNPDGWETRP